MIRRVPLSLVGLVVLLAACAPAASNPVAGGDQSTPKAAAPKVLVVGAQRALTGFGGAVGLPHDVGDLLSDGLVAKNFRGEWIPQLATQVISLQDGSWRINADGTMDTTWKLRPNIKWHDGTPMTSADLMLGFTINKDPTTPPDAATAGLVLATSAEAPDPLTLVVRWKDVWVRANEAIGLIPRPVHMLGAMYQATPAAVHTSQYFISDFVGVGPYRLEGFTLGVETLLQRFSDYYLGVPPIDRVIFHYMQDPATMVANILAGAVDILIPPGLDVDAAIDARRRWEGTGNRMILAPLQEDFTSAYSVQQRPDVAKPQDVATKRDVREALFRGIDRESLSEVITQSLGPVADSWIAPGHPVRTSVGPKIPQYPYDLSRAAQLLSASGWTKGADGVLVNGAGERFEYELAGPTRPELQKIQAIISDGWKPLGVVGTMRVLSSAEDTVAMNRSTMSGVYLGSVGADQYYFASQMHTRESTSAANWNLRNRGGYGSAAVDSLYDRLNKTVDTGARTGLYGDIAQIVMQDVGIWPFYWAPYPVLALAKVQGGVYPSKGMMMDNIMEWDIVS